MFNSRKKIFVLLIIVVIILISLMFFFNKKQKISKVEKKEQNSLVIPTVDNTVKVNIDKIKNGEIKVIINNSPKGTRSIDFEISYLVKNIDIAEEEENNLVSQGAIGSCYQEENQWYCGTGEGVNKKIVLGTCSSGVCRYHNIVSPLKLNLKFIGDYGEKVFEKEYQL